jgi:hypothetical protein
MRKQTLVVTALFLQMPVAVAECHEPGSPLVNYTSAHYSSHSADNGIKPEIGYI